jgi:hypothetical protein
MIYSYDRTASAGSFLNRKLTEAALSLADDLTKMAAKYTGSSQSKAVVEKMPQGVKVRLWIHLEEKADKSDFSEVAEFLLGKNFVIGPHVLTPNMWVAVADLPF